MDDTMEQGDCNRMWRHVSEQMRLLQFKSHVWRGLHEQNIHEFVAFDLVELLKGRFPWRHSLMRTKSLEDIENFVVMLWLAHAYWMSGGLALQRA